MRRYLLLGLSAVIMAALLLGALATYRLALWQADRIFDYQLRQVALSMRDQDFRSARAPPATAAGEQFDLVIQAWDRSGEHLYMSHPHSDLPDRVRLGYATLSTSEGAWRVYSVELRHHIVQVAQPLAIRQRLAASMALHLILPFVALLPILAGLAWLLVGRGLRPLLAMTQALKARNARSLEPLSTRGVPSELQPLVLTLNDLLARLAESLEALRDFTADAAHALRTPLAALTLQVQLSERARSDTERQSALAQLQDGLRRATHVVEQLLTLARQEPDVLEPAPGAIDLAALAGQVLADHAGLAEARHIDLGLGEVPESISVQGDAAALALMLANLVDNALRYTPPGGRVDVLLGTGATGPWLEVVDDGPGIPVEDRGRVFDRFYRRPGNTESGSGLGLAIVMRIVQRHQAAVMLADGPGGKGLRVRVSFPARG